MRRCFRVLVVIALVAWWPGLEVSEGADSFKDGLLMVGGMDGGSGPTGEELAVFCRTSVEILRSRVVMEKAVKLVAALKPEMGEELRSAVERGNLRLDASWIEGTRLIRVRETGVGGGLGAAYGDAVMTAFSKYLMERRAEAVESHISALLVQIHRLQQNEKSARERLREARENAAEEAGEEGERAVMEAEGNLEKASQLLQMLAERMRMLDIEKNLAPGQVFIVQRPSE